jgi:glycosyltransferase involved in cell wall biosynthesis
VTSHDLIPALQSRGYFGGELPSRAGQWLIRQSIKSLSFADLIIAVSRKTASDLTSFTGINGRIEVVYSSIAEHIIQASKGTFPSWIERRSYDGAYILHLGNNAYYKNREGVLNIFSRIIPECDIRLKMAGPAPTPELIQMVGDLGLAEKVEFISDPDEAEIVELYRHACLFLFPSIYEGFGWPPLEAMTCGCPVVCSDAASLPEIVGDAALSSPPDDERQMADNCLAVLENEGLAAQLIQRGFAQTGKFTLEKMGRELIGVYRDVINAYSR